MVNAFQIGTIVNTSAEFSLRRLFHSGGTVWFPGDCAMSNRLYHQKSRTPGSLRMETALNHGLSENEVYFDSDLDNKVSESAIR